MELTKAREIHTARGRAWRAAHPGKQYQLNKKWRWVHPLKWRASKQRYYNRGLKSASRGREGYVREEEMIILQRSFCDRVIAKMLGRSIRAIGIKRSRIRKEQLRRRPE